MHVMVTGGTGFIGSWVVEELLRAGHTLTVLARDPAKVAGFVDRPGLRFVRGTLVDRGAIREALRGADGCVHIALGWGDTAVAMAEADTVPALVIFEEAVRAGVRTIVHTSSIAAFGDGRTPVADGRSVVTDHTMPRPTDFYGATKAAAEAYLLALGSSSGVTVNVIRPGYTFGEPVTEGASIYTDTKLADLVRSGTAGEPVEAVRGDGTQFIWVGDLARAYRAVLSSSRSRRLYTAVSTNHTDWGEVAVLAAERAGRPSPVRWSAPTADGTPHDVSALQQDFGLSFDSSDRLRRHVAWLEERDR